MRIPHTSSACVDASLVVVRLPKAYAPAPTSKPMKNSYIVKNMVQILNMIPPDGSIIRFTSGFYPDRQYLVVDGGRLRSWDARLDTIFWEFFPDGQSIGPLGEARWRTDCEKLAVTFEVLNRIENWPPQPL
jgi:hypothetical protein